VRRRTCTISKVTSVVMGVHLLWLLLSSIGTLTIPPLSAVAVNNVATGTIDGNLSTRDRDQWSFPLLIREGGSTLEGDLQMLGRFLLTDMRAYSSAILQLGKIESSSSRDSHILDDNGGTRSLVLDRSRSIGEGAAGASIQARRRSRHERTSAEDKRCDLHGDHFKDGRE
jgi:hypothetical protein